MKPPLTEMAEGVTFNPELTAGYQVSTVLFHLFGYFTTFIICRHVVALKEIWYDDDDDDDNDG
jgi:hypothetical protein